MRTRPRSGQYSSASMIVRTRVVCAGSAGCREGAYALSQMLFMRGHLIGQIAVTAALGGSAYLLAVRHWKPHVYDDLRARLFKLLPEVGQRPNLLNCALSRNP